MVYHLSHILNTLWINHMPANLTDRELLRILWSGSVLPWLQQLQRGNCSAAVPHLSHQQRGQGGHIRTSFRERHGHHLEAKILQPQYALRRLLTSSPTSSPPGRGWRPLPNTYLLYWLNWRRWSRSVEKQELKACWPPSVSRRRSWRICSATPPSYHTPWRSLTGMAKNPPI